MRSFKQLSLKEKLAYIGIMAIYPLILFYGQLGKSVKFLNSRKRQIMASILTVCIMLTMIPVMAFSVSAATTPNVSYSIGKTYKYAVSKKFITSLSYGTSSSSTSNGSASISGSKATLSTGSDTDKLGKLVYASVAVKVSVPAYSAFSIDHKIAAAATRVSTGSTKASVFIYDLGQSDCSTSLTFYPYDDDENKNGQDSHEMKYTFGGKGVESISLNGTDDAIIYTNETDSAKTFTHYYGVMIAIQYGSTKNNRMQASFTFSNTVKSITNASNNGVTYKAFDEPWTAKKGTVPAGNYYLTSNFVGTDTYFINDTVNLCLNGKAFTWSGVNYARFRVNDGGTFGLYDCGSGSGSVTADDGEGAIANYGNGTVNMHGGTLTNIRFPGAAIANLAGGTVNVYGGTAIAEDGSGITVGTGIVNVYGGTINGANDGIYNGSTGTVNVSGGTVNGSGDNGIDNYSTGKVNISGSAKVIGKNRGIYNFRNGKITVKGGTVTGTKDGIYMTESAGTLNVTGGTITGTEGYGIDGYGTLSILAPAKVVGGTDGICCGSTDPILISATVEVTGDGGYGIYYYGSSTLDFSGTVTVSGTDGYGVFNRNAGTVNITGTVNATENYSCGVSNNGSGTVNILDGATVYSAENVGVRNRADGTVEMKGGAVTGRAYGIHNYDKGVIKMSGGTVTATTSKGIYNGHRGTLHITGGTVQSVNEYGVSSMGIAYLSNNPTISGALADLYYNSNYSSFYAESNDTTPVPYSGDNLSIYINEAIEDSIVVNNVTANNKNSFSLTDDVYYLEQRDDDLVLVKVPPHIHTDVEGEFTKLTKTSGSLVSGKYYLADDFTATGNLIVSAGNTVTLCLNGHTLDFDGIGETVINYGTLYICDCIGDGCLTVSGALENNGTLEFSGGKVYCEDGGTINNSGNLILSGGIVESGGTAYALSNYTSGTVTLSGADIIGYWGVYNQSTAKDAVTVTSGNIAATDDFGIYNYADGNITISGGTIISQSDAAIYNGKAGTVTVTDGKVSGKYGIYNKAGGTANISGGTVFGTNYGVLNYDDGAVKVSGGTVEATGTGNYIYGIDNSSNGTLTVSAGKISGTGYGIHTYGNTYITGGTVTGKNIAGIIVKRTNAGGTATHVSGGTVSGADNGIVLSGGSVYLSDKPTVTGDVADLHIVIGAGSNIYAQSSDASASYSGDPITVNAYNGKAGATVIRNVTDGNKEKFSVTNAGYKLKLGTGDNADNLVLAQAHTHQGVSGEFDELTDWSQLTTSGKYYISDNTPSVSRGYTIPSGAEVTLCLNGKTVDFDSEYFTVSGTFKICDCKNTGAIIGDPGHALVRNYGNFYIDSGSISSTAGYAISNSNSAANTTVTGTAKVSAKTSSNTACAIQGYGNITISGNATVSAECTVKSYYTDCISLYSFTKSLRISGNAKLISKAVTFATGVSTESSSTKVYISDNVSISVSTTTSGRNVYALDGPSTLYLSGNPTFSLNGGTSSAVLHPSPSSKIYVHSEDTVPVPYTGDPLTAYFYNHKSGDVAIYDTTDTNILKSVNPVYSIVVGTGENANNLLVKKAHTHDGVTGEFADWTAKSGTVSTSGTYYLFQDITATGNITIAKDTEVTLCLNGKTLDLGSNYIINEGTLTICDCQTTAGKITGTNAYSIKNKSALTVINGTVSGYRGISNTSTGTVEISGTAKIIGSGDGIFNEGTVSISGNATVSGTSEYGIQNYGTIYLSGSPIISGYASIYVLDGKIYAQSSDGSAAYTGGEITVRLYSSHEGDIIVYNVDDGNKDLFKLKDSYYLLTQSGENLILAVPHTHSWSDKWTYNSTHHWHECKNKDCTVTEDSKKDGYGEHTALADDGNCLTAVYCECGEVVVAARDEHTSDKEENKATYTKKAICDVCGTEYGEKLVDSIAPTGEIKIKNNGWLQFWNTVTFGLFCKDYVEITITGADAQTDVKSIEYYLSDTNISDKNIAGITDWTAYTGKVKIDENRKVFVYAKITDNAGNVTYISVNGGVVVYTDSEAVDTEATYKLTTGQNKRFYVTHNGNTVESVSLGNTVLIPNTDYRIANNGAENCQIVVYGTYLDTLAAGNHTFTVKYKPLGETYVEAEGNDKPAATEFTVKVEKKKIDKPQKDTNEFTYNGSEQTYTVAESEYYTVTGNKRTNAGEQDVIIALKDKNKTCWTDLSDNDIKFKFVINKDNFSTFVQQKGSLTYNGLEQTAQVETDESGLGSQLATYKYGLSENACTEACVPAFKNAGTYTVYYTASCSNFNDSKGSFKVKIDKATPNIGEVSVTAPSEIHFNTALGDITLGREDTTISGSLKLTGGQVLAVGTKDYDWSFKPDDTANYENATGKVSITVSKIKLNVEGVSWYTADSPFIYDGTKKSVELNGTLPTGVVVDKSGNTAINAGSYTATATFKLAEGYSSSNYEIVGATDNKVTANWQIDPRVVVAEVVVIPESYTYTGDPIVPSSVIVNDGGAVIPASEYDIDYSNNTNAGTATVTVKDKVGGNYTVSGTKNFNIGKATFTADVKQNGTLTYDGHEQTANVTTTPSGVKGGQTVTYKYGLTENACNSADVPAFKNAGTYTVYFVATANNHNDVKGSFTVTVEKKELTVTANDHSITYGDAPSNNGVTYIGFVNGEEANVLDGTLSFEYSYAQYDDIGDNFTIKPKNLTAANYEITFVPGTLTVNARPLVDGDFTAITDGYIYTGLENEPAVSTTNSLISATDYTVAYENNINAGENTAKITITGKNNASGTVYIYFSISKADPPVMWPFSPVGNAGDKLSTVALKNGFTWDNADTTIAYGDNYYGMTYTPADTDNYNILKKNIRVNGLDVTFPTGEITLKDNKWNEFLNDITFGLFFKETQEISITAADTESGVKEIAYYLSADELSADDVKALENSKWTVYTDAFNVEPDNKYIVYARITDNAENIIYINSEGIVLDSIKPIIAGIEDGKDVYGDATFTVDEENLDNVTIDGKPIEVKDGKYTVPADNKEHTVVVTDKSGNKTEYKLAIYKNYNVSFVVDGKEIEVIEVGYGKNATLPEIPEKKGYKAKWDKDGKNITADTVITAVYEKLPLSPQTGDSTNMSMWATLLVMSGLSVFGILFAKKRKEQEAE